ncbi:MAG: shikimate kinase [Candidatus Omnitrophota bacterium]
MNKNIVLVGFMGAGKSVTAKQLQELSQRSLVSTDELIEKKEGKAISRIFQENGEAYFRDLERKVIEEISRKENLIIDCGGGVILDQGNIDNLKKNGVIFYLKVSPEIIYERIKHETHRPLLKVDNPKIKIKELLEKRQSRYEQADQIIDTSGKTIDQVAGSILKLI